MAKLLRQNFSFLNSVVFVNFVVLLRVRNDSDSQPMERQFKQDTLNVAPKKMAKNYCNENPLV